MIVEVEQQRHGIDLIKIDNNETSIVFSNYGARIVAWKFHDNNIVLGNRVEADEFYLNNPLKFGATIGRYSGRIEAGAFKLNQDRYQLEQNDGLNHIHGGSNGCDQVLFDYDIVEGISDVKVIFKAKLNASDDGYPGELALKVIHHYDIEHRWTITYEAETTATTIFNPTNHVYFNLNRDNNVIDNHQIHAKDLKMYLLNRQHFLLNDTPINLTSQFGSDHITFQEIFQAHQDDIKQQMERYQGLDHPFELSEQTLSVENGEFKLQIDTDMPYVVIYTMNHPETWESQLNIYKPHSGFTLETQFLPNDINYFGQQAPSILRAGQQFSSTTSYQISEQ